MLQSKRGPPRVRSPPIRHDDLSKKKGDRHADQR